MEEEFLFEGRGQEVEMFPGRGPANGLGKYHHQA